MRKRSWSRFDFTR